MLGTSLLLLVFIFAAATLYSVLTISFVISSEPWHMQTPAYSGIFRYIWAQSSIFQAQPDIFRYYSGTIRNIKNPV